MRLATLFCTLFLLPVAASAQWKFSGPGLFTPRAVAQNSSHVFFAATRGSGASADGGYVYRSADGGKTWADATANLVTAQKPLGPNLTALGAGDGLVAAAERAAFNKANVHLSTDNGASWLVKTNFPTVVEGGIQHLLVPDASTVIAYAHTGSSRAQFIVSTDAGATWTVQPEVFNPVGQSPPVRAGNTLAILHTRRVNNTNETGVFVSNDLGATWTLAQSLTVFATSLPLWADGNRIYYATQNGTTTTIRWTADGGATWQSKSTTPAALTNTSRIDAMVSRGNTLVLKTLVTQRPRPGGGGVESFNDDVMIYSTDFGDTWQMGDPDSTLLRAQHNRNISNTSPPIGIVATRSGFLYANITSGTFGNRLYYSADGVDWDAVNVNGFGRDMGNVVPFGGALLAFEDETIASGAGFFRSDDGGASWRYLTRLNYGFNTSEGCAQQHGLGLVAVVSGKVVAVCEADVYHSTDGVNFSKVGANAVPTGRTKMLSEADGVLYLLSWSSSLSGYGGQNAVLYTSADAGLTWTQQASALRTVTRPSVGGTNVMLTDRTSAYFSTDGGATFGSTNTLFGSNQAGVAATPTALFAGSGFERLFGTVFLNKKTFFRSTDGGATWQDLIAAGVVADGPRSLHSDGSLLIATFTDSVAVSQDDGQTWHGLAAGWPRESLTEDAFVAHGNVYVQTLNGGLYYTSFASLGIAVAAERDVVLPTLDLVAFPNPARQSTRLRYTLDRAQPIVVTAYDVLGREVARLHDAPVEAGTHTLGWSLDGLAAGVYVVRLRTADGRSQTQTVVRL